MYGHEFLTPGLYKILRSLSEKKQVLRTPRSMTRNTQLMKSISLRRIDVPLKELFVSNVFNVCLCAMLVCLETSIPRTDSAYWI